MLVSMFPIVADHVKEAMGEALYVKFLVKSQIFITDYKELNINIISVKADPDGLYSKMTPIEADVCRSNKVRIPYRSAN